MEQRILILSMGLALGGAFAGCLNVLDEPVARPAPGPASSAESDAPLPINPERPDRTVLMDSATCSAGSAVNCVGACTPLATKNQQLGDGACQSWWNCEQWDWDSGDCEPRDGCPGGLESCVGSCMSASQPGNGACNYWANCAAHNYDGGDCPLIDTGNCGYNELQGCTGGCVAPSSKGNGWCDVSLNCPENDWDGGDCLADDDAGCEDGYIVNCNGQCSSPGTQVWRGNGNCQAMWNCAEYNWDDGDCAPPGGDDDDDDDDDDGQSTCLSSQVLNCFGGCTSSWWLDDGYCDSALNCAAHNFDDGDCGAGADDADDDDDDAGCSAGYIPNCWGTCTLASWIDDNYCDSALNCAATGYDGGDCGGSTADDDDDDDGVQCASYQVENCLGGCTYASWVGDHYCDTSLNCAAHNFDDGDCSASTPPASPGSGCDADEVVDCGGLCSDADWVGDGTCDSWLNCAAHDQDGGDCG